MAKASFSKVRLTCRFWTPRLVVIFVATLTVVAGLVTLVTQYWPGDFSVLRTVNVFCLVMFVVIFYGVGSCVKQFYSAYNGELKDKPFARRDDKGRMYELFNVNGKYSLWRIYAGERLEMVYQIYNYSLYTCILSPWFLLFFNMAMICEVAFRVYNLRSPQMPINRDLKSKEILTNPRKS